MLSPGLNRPLTHLMAIDVVALKLDPEGCLSAWNILRV